MLYKIRQRAQSQEGFTLIELLVVILIIGILAAIALPSFLNQRGKAQDAEAKSAARTAQTAEETWYTDYQSYTDVEANLTGLEPALNSALNLTATLVGNGYSVSVESKSKDATVYTITADGNGGVTRTCDDPGVGGCKVGSVW